MAHEQDVPYVAADVFGIPLGSVAGELVPYMPAPSPVGQPPTPTPVLLAQQPEPAAAQAAAIEQDRLRDLCHRLRRSHRCPGRCVFTGELQQTGLQTFHAGLEA